MATRVRFPAGSRVITAAELRSAAVVVVPACDEDAAWPQAVLERVSARCEELAIPVPLLVWSSDPATEWQLAVTSREEALAVIDRLAEAFSLVELRGAIRFSEAAGAGATGRTGRSG